MEERRAARKKLVARMRDVGGRIRANLSIPTPLKIVLGLPVRRSRDGGLLAPIETPDGQEIPVRGSGRIGRPRTCPLVYVGPSSVRTGGVGDDQIAVNLADELTPSRRTRPATTLGAGLWFAIGKTAPADLGDWRFVRVFTRARARFAISQRVLARAAAASGAAPGETVALTVWLAACWISPTGEPGPASRPVSVTLLGQADRAATPIEATPESATPPPASRVAA